ncbi:hypothetical protein [Nitrincola sp.]|uniref:hypothetical protein n=1 Tax=Nitrincola sp. TaxID=1926584 RepID=UPI003A8D3600
MAAEQKDKVLVLEVLDAMRALGFEPRSIKDVAEHLDLDYQAVRRAMLVLESYQWVVKGGAPGKSLWAVSAKALDFSIQYKRHALNRVHQMEREYFNLTGEVLRDEKD